MKEVRVALTMVMNVMISNSRGGMGLSIGSFKDLNTKCNTIGQFKWLYGLLFSFALLVGS